MSMLSTILNTASQAAVFTVNIFSIGFRGLRIYQTYHDPNIGNTSRWTSIALNSVSIATQTASCSSSLQDKQIEQLTAISNAAGVGADIIHLIGDENSTTTSNAILIMKFLSATNQIRGGRKELSDLVHIAEAVTFCFENRNWIGEQALELKNRSRKKTTKKKYLKALSVPMDGMNPKKVYQKILTNCRNKYPEVPNLNILFTSRGFVLRQEVQVESNRKECEAIIKGLKITDFKKIPCILEEEFTDRICGIYKKPVYTVVTIQESIDHEPIYYEWSDLFTCIQNEQPPKNWPKAVPFGPEALIVDTVATQNIQTRLKKAALRPNIPERAKMTLMQLDKQKKLLEEIKILSLADIIGSEIDEKCIKVIDEGLLINELKINELRRD